MALLSWRVDRLIGSSAQANVWGSPPFAQRELCSWRYSPGVLIGSTAQAEVWVHRRLPSASNVAALLRSVPTFRGKRGVPAYVPLGWRSSILNFQRYFSMPTERRPPSHVYHGTWARNVGCNKQPRHEPAVPRKHPSQATDKAPLFDSSLGSRALHTLLAC